MYTLPPYQVAQVSGSRDRYANRDGHLIWPSEASGSPLLVALVCDAPDAADATTPRQVHKLATAWLTEHIAPGQETVGLEPSLLVAQLAGFLNNKLKDLNREEAQERFLCTLTVACLQGGKAYLLCVGDSPWAHLRPLGSGDFSYSPYAETTIFSGPYGKTDSSISSRSSGRQTAFIGRELLNFRPSRVSSLELRPGDWLFLMSDGLEKMVPHRRLVDHALATAAPEELKARLTENYLGGSLTDDVTLVAIRINNGLIQDHPIRINEVESLVDRKISDRLMPFESERAGLATRLEQSFSGLQQTLGAINEELAGLKAKILSWKPSDSDTLTLTHLSERLGKTDNLITNTRADLNGLQECLRTLQDTLEQLAKDVQPSGTLGQQILATVSGLESKLESRFAATDAELKLLGGSLDRREPAREEEPIPPPQAQENELSPLPPPLPVPQPPPVVTVPVPMESTPEPVSLVADDEKPKTSRFRIDATLRQVWELIWRRRRLVLLPLLLLLGIIVWKLIPWPTASSTTKKTEEESPPTTVKTSALKVSQLPGGWEGAEPDQLSLVPKEIWTVPPVWMKVTGLSKTTLERFLASYQDAYTRKLTGDSGEDLSRLCPAPSQRGTDWQVEVPYFEQSIPTKEILIAPRDTLIDIVIREKTDTATLYSLNERAKLDNLRAGSTLRLPAEGALLQLFYTPPTPPTDWKDALKPRGDAAWQQVQAYYADILREAIPDPSQSIQVPYGFSASRVPYQAKPGDTVAEVARRFHLTPFHLLWLNRDRAVVPSGATGG